jgi:hypothetical protein
MSVFAMIAALTAELFILRPWATFPRRLSRHAASCANGGKWPTDSGLLALSFAQSDRHGSYVGAALWPYHDRLPFALGPHVETGREAGASHIGPCAAGNISRHTSGRLGPGAGQRAAFGNDVAADFPAPK